MTPPFHDFRAAMSASRPCEAINHHSSKSQLSMKSTDLDIEMVSRLVEQQNVRVHQ
jgi:hypothetical protein